MDPEWQGVERCSRIRAAQVSYAASNKGMKLTGHSWHHERLGSPAAYPQCSADFSRGAPEISVFATQSEAKHFFVERLVAQALGEGRPLSSQEQRLLQVSVSDPESLADIDDGADVSDSEFESRVAGLIRRSYRADVKANAESEGVYRDAYARLAEGDHYVLVMIEQAIGRRLTRRGIATKSGMFLLLVVPGVVALLFAIALAWGLISNPPHDARDFSVAAIVAFVFGGFGLFLGALWWREH